MSALHSTNNTGRRLDEAKQREIFNACAQGESVAAVGRRFHVSRPTVYRIIERFTPGPSTVREDCRITVRLSREELGELDALAEQHKVSRSELTRKIVRLAAGFLAPDDDWSEAARDLTRQVKGIGGNLNQIAFHMNRDARETGRALIGPTIIEETRELQNQLRLLAKDVDGLLVTAATRRQARVASLMKRLD